MHSYTAHALLEIRRTMAHNLVTRPFTSKKWIALKVLKIVRTTKRGYCGGMLRNKFQIPTVVTAPTHSPFTKPCCRSVGEHNLVCVSETSPAVTVTQKSRLAIWNANSLKKKTTSLTDFIIREKIYLFAITESW